MKGLQGLRPFLGLALVGYGLILLLQVVPHEAPWIGALSLGLGAALLVAGLPRLGRLRGRVVAAVGAVCLVGVIGYNVMQRSGLSAPEWGILAYGAALLAAAPFLGRQVGRVELGALVGWSFPLVLAPLAMFALNAMLSGESGGNAADPLVHTFVVLPSAALLGLVGTPVEVVQNNLVLGTPRGTLVLGVGLVCAGLYPMVLFTGLVALHGWQQRVARRRLAAYLGVGLACLWLLNLVRLVILTKVGQRWGGEALQTTHAHLGWILFALFMVVYWAVVLRRIEPRAQAAAAP